MAKGLSVVVRLKSLSDILKSVFVVARNVSKNMACPVEEFACNQEGGKMRCTSPVRLRHLSPSLYPDGLLVPCGKCLACRIAKRTEWAMRMLHELSDYDDAVFVTLTYDEDHIPSNQSLKKSDLQKWFKRVRKEIEPKKIRYFACGEYGEKRCRWNEQDY